uniref:Uncharacterized protein n=1 Tax=Arundo donax TaxID=35708 RepID=A0A0A8YTK2_ARUDO
MIYLVWPFCRELKKKVLKSSLSY